MVPNRESMPLQMRTASVEVRAVMRRVKRAEGGRPGIIAILLSQALSTV